MTESRSQTDLESLLHRADAAVMLPAVALDPVRIGEMANKRVRRRRVATTAMTTCCLLLAGYFAIRRGPEENNITTSDQPTATELLAELDQLHRQFDSVMATAEETLARDEIQDDRSFAERLQQQVRLAELQEEVARLEAEVQQQPADDWQLAWLRSGARRLALAKLDAELDPNSAAESFRRLATSYAGSPISDAAMIALQKLPEP